MSLLQRQRWTLKISPHKVTKAVVNSQINSPIKSDQRLQCGRFELILNRPFIMGVVNVTPDSFSDGGQHATTQAAIAHARNLVMQGADILDIGGESTRPGSAAVSVDEELARVIPVIEALRDDGIALSVDTRRSEVMRDALIAGADMINDVQGFASQAAINLMAQSNCACCVMHMQGDPSTMQLAPTYRDVVGDVSDFFYHQVKQLHDAGVALNRIVVDPGIGFGKTLDHNLELLKNLNRFAAFGDSEEAIAVLVGLSRKSLVGHITGRSVDKRLAGSLGGAIAAVLNGARIIRVHDVEQTKDALAVFYQIAGYTNSKNELSS